MQWALGGPASGAPQHFHNTAWNACVYGAKKWLVYPPAYALMSNEQIRKWDEDDRSELEKDGQPSPLTCVQRAGDVAVVPEMWGHGVVNLEETLAVATEVRMALFRPPLPKAFRQVAAVLRRREPPKKGVERRGHHGGEEPAEAASSSSAAAAPHRPAAFVCVTCVEIDSPCRSTLLHARRSGRRRRGPRLSIRFLSPHA